MAKICSREGCERGCYGEFCLIHKPRKPLQAKSRYIKPESDKNRERRLKVRDKWFDQNPPDIDSKWYCYLDGLSEQCWTLMDREQIEQHGLEHVIAKVKNPSLKFEVANLRVACPPCNAVKGSWRLEQLLGMYEYWGGPRT